MVVENPVNPPKILLTGTRVTQNANGAIKKTNVNKKNYGNDTTRDNGSGGKVFRNLNPFMFLDKVQVEMTVDSLTLKNYDEVPDEDDKTFVGSLRDPENVNKAEIVYTINGKDPKRTEYTIYKKPFYLRSNTNGTPQENVGGDNIVLKAKTYYQGRWSDVTELEIKLV